jgi:Kef-type K+ transport system membrane component KefB
MVVTPEGNLLVLLIILAIGLVIPELFKRFKLPFVTLIILLGALIGPNGLDYVRSNELIEFFGFLGLTFLMLMAGLETKTKQLKLELRKILLIAAFNGIIPFIVGVFITNYFGYSRIASLLVGIIFMSSSVAIVVPSLKAAHLFKKDIGQLMLSAVLVMDILSLIFLGVVLQISSPLTGLPLPIYFLLLFGVVGLFFYFAPILSRHFLKSHFSKDKEHESRLRFIIVVLIGSLVLFSWVGIHPILGAFFVGLMLSFVVHDKGAEEIYRKIHTIGYGLFIPVFFFVIGMEVDLGTLKSLGGNNVVIAIVLGLIFSKVISGYVATRLVKFPKKEALTFSLISMTKLTTVLAITYTASTLGLIDSTLVTAIVSLSVITTFLGPTLANFVENRK